MTWAKIWQIHTPYDNKESFASLSCHMLPHNTIERDKVISINSKNITIGCAADIVVRAILAIVIKYYIPLDIRSR